MYRVQERQGVVERVILQLLVALFLFATPVIYAWARDGGPWYLPYILWLGLIGWIAWGQFRVPRHDV